MLLPRPALGCPDIKLRFLVLLVPPVCLFLAFRHRLDDYTLSDLPSVSLPFYHSSSSGRQSCTPEQWSNGAWVAKKRTSSGIEDGVFAASQFEGCASNFAPTWHLGTFPEEVLTEKRFEKGGYEWVPTDECFMRPFAKENLIRDLVAGGWMLIGGMFSHFSFEFVSKSLHTDLKYLQILWKKDTCFPYLVCFILT